MSLIILDELFMAVSIAIGTFTMIAAALTTQDDKLLPHQKLKVMGGYLFASVLLWMNFIDLLRNWISTI